MKTNDPIFANRKAVDLFCLEVEEKGKRAQDEFEKLIGISGLINAAVFIFIVPFLIVRGFEFLGRRLSNVEETIVYILVFLVGAVIVRINYLEKAFERRAELFCDLDTLPELEKPIGPYTLQLLNELAKCSIRPGLLFSLLIISNGRLQFLPKVVRVYGMLLGTSIVGIIPTGFVVGLLIWLLEATGVIRK